MSYTNTCRFVCVRVLGTLLFIGVCVCVCVMSFVYDVIITTPEFEAGKVRRYWTDRKKATQFYAQLIHFVQVS